MSISPATSPGSIGTDSGLAGIISDLRRRLAQVEATRTSIAAASLTGTQIAAGTITGDNLEVGSITTGTIAAGSITTELIAAGAIVAGLISANAVTADAIAAGAITAGKISADAISATNIQAGAILTGSISAGAVTADKIAAGAVTSDKITVTNLSAITTNMGNITAGLITGAIIQTSSSGSRVVMDSFGLHGYGLDGVTKIFDIDAGSGIASFTGVAHIDPASVVPGGAISDATITGAKIAAGTITATNIAAGTIEAGLVDVVFDGPNLLFNSGFEYGIDDDGVYSTSMQHWQGGKATGAAVATTLEAWEGQQSAKVQSILNVQPPGGLSATPGSHGSGTLISGGYTYKVTAVGTAGETDASVVSVTAPQSVLNTTGVGISDANSSTGPDGTYSFNVTAVTPTGETAPTSVSYTASPTYPGDPPQPSVAPTSESTNPLVSGSHLFVLVAKDASGNLSNPGATRSFIPSGSQACRLSIAHTSSFNGYASFSVYHQLPNGTWNHYNDFPNPGPGHTYFILVKSNAASYGIDDLLAPNAAPSRTTGASAPPAATGSVATGPVHNPDVFWNSIPSATSYRVYATSSPGSLGWSVSSPYTYWETTSTDVTPVATTPTGTRSSWPTTPLNVDTSDNSLSLSWSASASATGYRIYRASVPSGSGIPTGLLASMSGAGPLVDTGQALTTGGATAPATNSAALPDAPYVWTADTPTFVYEGTEYTASAWVKGAAGSIGADAYITLLAYTGPTLGDYLNSYDSTHVTLTGEWQEVRFGPWTAPPTSEYVRVKVSSTQINHGESFYVDGVQLTRGGLFGAYGPRSDDYVPGSIGPTIITPNSITTDQILAGSIQADRIVAGSITSTQISANAITADKISAGAIDGKVITGALIQSAASGARTQLSSSGFEVKDSSSNTVAALRAPGGALDILQATSVSWTGAEAGRQIRWLTGSNLASGGVPISGISALSNSMVMRTADPSGAGFSELALISELGPLGGGLSSTAFSLSASATDSQRQINISAGLASGIHDTSFIMLLNGLGETGFIRNHSPVQSGHSFSKMGIWGPFTIANTLIPPGATATFAVTHNTNTNFGPIVGYQILGSPITATLGDASSAWFGWTWSGAFDTASIYVINHHPSVTLAGEFVYSILYYA